jgi:glutamyl-tRNA synthetase
VRLGWSHGDQEIFSMDEMIQFFDIKDVNKAASAFNNEKLLWLNHHYIKTLPATEIAEHLRWHMVDQKIDTTNGPALDLVVKVLAERSKTLKEMAAASRYFYEDFDAFDAASAEKQLTEQTKPALEMLLQQLREVSSFTAPEIHAVIDETCKTLGVGFGKVAPPLRVAITGSTVSPSIDITAELIGRERVLARIERALKFVANKA